MREKEERDGALGHEEGEGWQEVKSKRKRPFSGRKNSTDVASNVKGKLLENTISFYFTEFPEPHGAKEMLRAFSYYGEAMEVVIPPKRDKRGNRFGFVRFTNVREPEFFAIELDNIIIGAKKIHVNLPRFQREWVDEKKTSKEQHQVKVKQAVQQKEQHQVKAKQAVQQGQYQKQGKQQMGWRKKERKKEGRDEEGLRVNYNHGVAGRSIRRFGNLVPPRIVYHRKNNISEVCYNVSEEEMQKYNKMYVGVVSTPGSTYSVQEWFSMQGIFSIKVTPLGANKVLLEEMEEGVVAALLDDDADWFHGRFEDVRLWSQEEADNERVVWVRCHGVPVHAWNEEFFASLARKFGDFLGVDEATNLKTSMDIARIKIRSRSYDVFNMVVTANINGSLFDIKMVEEWCGPLQWICLSKGGDEDEGERFAGGGWMKKAQMSQKMMLVMDLLCSWRMWKGSTVVLIRRGRWQGRWQVMMRRVWKSRLRRLSKKPLMFPKKRRAVVVGGAMMMLLGMM